MSLSLSSSTYNRQNWEDSEFPILCETCLGANPYVRMIKDKYGRECKVCERPFTTFRWCPGPRMRYKKTEICQCCARLKNVCQTCLLDLEYGLPVQIRESASGQEVTQLPKNPVNREYFMQAVERGQLQIAPPNAPPSEIMTKLARQSPYYQRNRPHICSFWVKGECKRGEECPYRHEMPTDPEDPISDQNIRDRYYGRNDPVRKIPVADKLLKRYNESLPVQSVPEDKSITSLILTGNNLNLISERHIRDVFYQYGELVNVIVDASHAIVQYATREAAEKAAASPAFVANGVKLNVAWAKAPSAPSDYLDSVKHFDQPASHHTYPSQDPSRLGSYGKISKPF